MPAPLCACILGIFMEEVYLGLGGNIGDTHAIFDQALQLIQNTPGIYCLKTSSYYLTSPVSPIPQSDYINAVAHFKTSLSPKELFIRLKKIESFLGKIPKIKDAPRIIDLDILFFGCKYLRTQELSIPHPRWMERLFVLVPLSELTEVITVADGRSIHLHSFIESFANPHNETVGVLCAK